jgi:hypothetical protein
MLAAYAAAALPSQAFAESTMSAQASSRYTVRVVVSGAKKGSISPSSRQTVTSGRSLSYTIKPQRGYLIESLTVNGAPKTNLPRQKGKSYSFTVPKISENKTITVAFSTSRDTKPLSIGSQVSVVDAK